MERAFVAALRMVIAVAAAGGAFAVAGVLIVGKIIGEKASALVLSCRGEAEPRCGRRGGFEMSLRDQFAQRGFGHLRINVQEGTENRSIEYAAETLAFVPKADLQDLFAIDEPGHCVTAFRPCRLRVNRLLRHVS